MRALILALSLLLVACATPGPAPGAVQRLPDTYAVNGRVAVKAGQRGYSANFQWQHSPALDAVDVSNPLGQVLARLELDAGGARFFDADGKQDVADDAESLAEAKLGWRLPVLGMRYWLLGLADPQRPAAWSAVESGRILQQDGWSIAYPVVDGHAPQRLTLSRPDLEVRIALYGWQIGGVPAGGVDKEAKP